MAHITHIKTWILKLILTFILFLGFFIVFLPTGECETEDKETLYVGRSGLGNYSFIQDAIKAIWLAANKGNPGETYNICSNRKTQIRELLNFALSFSKKQIKVIENVQSKIRKTDEDVLVGDNSKIKNDLGFTVSKTIEQTLKDMYDYWIDYYKKNKD